MSDVEPIDIGRVLEEIPDFHGRDVEWHGLSGGLTNLSYAVDCEGSRYVLRVPAPHTDVFGLDRQREQRAGNAAAAAGIGPRIVYADTDRGVMLREYVEGDVWSADDLVAPTNLEKIASLLRRVHSLPILDSPFDIVRVAHHYRQHVDGSLARFADVCVRLAENAGRVEQRCVCHGDVNAANVISGDRLLLIDWEYACDNDPFFDLAALIGYHDMTDEQINVLLCAYTGGVDDTAFDRLREQTAIFDVTQWLWFASRCGSDPDERTIERLTTLEERIRQRS